MAGRKKGKQKGGMGSKRQRYACERLRWSEASDDLGCERVLERQKKRSSSSSTAELPKKDDFVEEALEEDGAKPLPHREIQEQKTLLDLCVSAVGRDLQWYSAQDEGTALLFGILPSRIVSKVSALGKMTPQNCSLFARPDLRDLTIQGDLSCIDCLVPKSRLLLDDIPDDWSNSDYDLSPLLYGCSQLNSLEIICGHFEDFGRVLALSQACPLRVVRIVGSIEEKKAADIFLQYENEWQTVIFDAFLCREVCPRLERLDLREFPLCTARGLLTHLQKRNSSRDAGFFDASLRRNCTSRTELRSDLQFTSNKEKDRFLEVLVPPTFFLSSSAPHHGALSEADNIHLGPPLRRECRRFGLRLIVIQ